MCVGGRHGRVAGNHLRVVRQGRRHGPCQRDRRGLDRADASRPRRILPTLRDIADRVKVLRRLALVQVPGQRPDRPGRRALELKQQQGCGDHV